MSKPAHAVIMAQSHEAVKNAQKLLKREPAAPKEALCAAREVLDKFIKELKPASPGESMHLQMMKNYKRNLHIRIHRLEKFPEATS